MVTELISQIRALIASGQETKSGMAKAAGLSVNALATVDADDWNPTRTTLEALEAYLLRRAGVDVEPNGDETTSSSNKGEPVMDRAAA